MPDVMLAGSDGSESSLRAVEFGAERARHFDARLVVVHVIEWSPYTFNTPEENELRHKRRGEEIERARTQIVNPLVKSLQERGIKVEGMVRHGHVAEIMRGLAEELGANQIFVGRRGQSRINALLFGSVAGSLIQISPVPVTVVP